MRTAADAVVAFARDIEYRDGRVWKTVEGYPMRPRIARITARKMRASEDYRNVHVFRVYRKERADAAC